MKSRLQKMSFLNTLAISFTAIAPTCAMAFNTTAVAKFAGIHMPLSFIFGGMAILLVGACFAIMASQTSGVGSAYAYNKLALGERAGFVTGWILTMVYVVGGAGAIAMSTNFLQVLFGRFGLKASAVLIALGMLVLLYLINLLGIKIASDISLIIEVIAIIVLAVICGAVMIHGGMNGMNLQPFAFHASNLPGIGQGIIYVIICFAGFEESTTMAVRTRNPKRTIPITIISTIILVALIFIAVSYVQVIGYGEAHVGNLINSKAPLNYLAQTYMGGKMATLIDFATTISSIASFMGIMNAGAYMLYALGKEHYLPKPLGRFNKHLATPLFALTTLPLLYAIEYVALGLPLGNNMAYSMYMGIAGLSFLVVYILVCVGIITYIHRKQGVSNPHFRGSCLMLPVN
ncbi:MAG: APC family permease [Acetilactobacillus jinshanensis]